MKGKNKILWASTLRGSSLSENRPCQNRTNLDTLTQPAQKQKKPQSSNTLYIMSVSDWVYSSFQFCLFFTLTKWQWFHTARDEQPADEPLHLCHFPCTTTYPPTYPCTNHPHWCETSLCQIVCQSPKPHLWFSVTDLYAVLMQHRHENYHPAPPPPSPLCIIQDISSCDRMGLVTHALSCISNPTITTAATPQQKICTNLCFRQAIRAVNWV